jgi:hypothetical protein
VSISEVLFSRFQKTCSAIDQNVVFKPVLQATLLANFSKVLFTGSVRTFESIDAQQALRWPE